MIYHDHTLRTNTSHHEDEQNNSDHNTPGRQTKHSNQLSPHHQEVCKTRTDTKYTFFVVHWITSVSSESELLPVRYG